jgi:hypothetical protein
MPDSSLSKEELIASKSSCTTRREEEQCHPGPELAGAIEGSYKNCFI